MDGLFEQNDRECLRNTMLRQEEIFKQQVHELHLLYRVQKLLMAELRTKEAKFQSVATADTPTTIKETKVRYWSGTSTSETSHSSYNSNRPLSTPHSNSDYNSLRQFSTLAEDYPTKQKGFDLEQPVTEENSMPLDRSKDVWVEAECDVELTLSTGRGSGKKKPEHWLQPEPDPSDMRQKVLSRVPVRSERGEECSERERRPPWLFQAMSLK
ncbi:uncharacterized protein M6B38_405080 [Iris pallida]|uniref:MYB-CC type transcription factor LHEQLE-containing domain-containing protein n=1 Tax=Iris pallida TaxID=29817 RepID=A0AAX6FRM8_IRIPA|nr:uncharacterized protein M6B38_405080 [Iris pallida]